MPSDPREAGAKGGRSKSPAKVAAARRNGFQKVANQPELPFAAQKASENAKRS